MTPPVASQPPIGHGTGFALRRCCRTPTIAPSRCLRHADSKLTPYFFTREHAAEDVYVTGTFDNWTKSVRLEKVGDVFQKTVELPEASQKIYYKVRLTFVLITLEFCFTLLPQ